MDLRANRRDHDGEAVKSERESCRMHRCQFLLSGLLECGCCGGSYAILVPERYQWSMRRSK
jgi:hypothetical protein